MIAPPDTSIVTVAGLTKRYGSTLALDAVDLSLGPGVTGLLGPNGAGKTTLIRLLTTAAAPTEGRISVLGHDATGALPERTEVRRTLGYLPQEVRFPRGLTCFAFVDYIAVLKEWTDTARRHAEVRRVLDLVDLGDRATKKIRALSGGQRRRLALAQAFLGTPRLLVLDEPTTGLDPEQRASLRALLSEHGRTGTVLLATHQTEDVAALCERVIVIADGRVRFAGGRPTSSTPPPDRSGSPTPRSRVAVCPGAPAPDRSGRSAVRRPPKHDPPSPRSRTPTY